MKPEDENIMAELIEKLTGYICANVCKHRYLLRLFEKTTEKEIQESCDKCEINTFLNQMQAEYDKINDFNNTQLAILMKKHRKIVLCKNCAFRKDDNDCQGMDFSWCQANGLDGNVEEYDGCSRGRDIRKIMEVEDDSKTDD